MLRSLAALTFLFCAMLCAKAPDDPVTDGDLAYRRGDYAEAVKRYREAANDDRWPELQAAAQDRLGRMYSQGDHVARNGPEAIAWLEKSTALGDVEAPADLADVYFFAYGVPRDLAKATHWYQQAADRGSLHGTDQLAWCYLNGMGLAKDVDKARNLYLKTAQRGGVTGAYQYAWILAHIEPLNYGEAMTWYLKAAALNHATAKNNIGYMYEQGHGVKKDYATAARWYEQAANANDLRGQYHLGLLYERGFGVTKNMEKATTLMRASAAGGDEDAMDWLRAHNVDLSP